MLLPVRRSYAGGTERVEHGRVAVRELKELESALVRKAGNWSARDPLPSRKSTTVLRRTSETMIRKASPLPSSQEAQPLQVRVRGDSAASVPIAETSRSLLS
jgi:hypothetical protein